MTPLEEGSTLRRGLYLTTHNIHKRQKSTPPAGFELTLSAGQRPQTYAFDRGAIGTVCYEGDSNENLKSAIKIQNTARLSCKLTIMILMV
jgi:hypothetical protein